MSKRKYNRKDRKYNQLLTAKQLLDELDKKEAEKKRIKEEIRRGKMPLPSVETPSTSVRTISGGAFETNRRRH
jgi:hypothetical protein